MYFYVPRRFHVHISLIADALQLRHSRGWFRLIALNLMPPHPLIWRDPQLIE